MPEPLKADPSAAEPAAPAAGSVPPVDPAALLRAGAWAAGGTALGLGLVAAPLLARSPLVGLGVGGALSLAAGVGAALETRRREREVADSREAAVRFRQATARLSNEEALHARRQELLRAQVEIQSALMTVAADDDKERSAMELLAHAIPASRALLFRTYEGSGGSTRAGLDARWPAETDEEILPRDICLSELLPQTLTELEAGSLVHGPIARRAASERAFWQRHGAVSMAVAPVHLSRRLGAVLMVESNDPAFVWDEPALELLPGVADALGRMMARREAELSALQLAQRDPLTGLANRRHLGERLEAAIEMARQRRRGVAALYLDLDRFKQINDLLGHGFGDRFLQFVVRHRLEPCLDRRDLLARVGGDEFVFVMSERDPAELVDCAAQMAESLQRALSEPILVEGYELVVSASIGISRFPNDGTDAETLLKHADVAMYSAKGEGTGGYRFFTAKMSRSSHERFELEADLRHDLDPRYFTDDRFILHYQPQVDVDKASLIGVESLIRWRHARRKTLVSPGLFIPLAEETGLIQPLSRWVLRSACLQAASWASQGNPVRVAVNLSAHQLRSRDLIRQVSDVLEATGLPPQLLDLEMTETALLTDVSEALEVMTELRKMGVFLSLDDFGAGYSSLSHLRQYPFHVVKIDRSFVKSIVGNSRDQLVVKALVGLARDLGMTIIAEGVESVIQREILQRLGCHYLQGYLLSPPIPAEELERRFLTERNGNQYIPRAA